MAQLEKYKGEKRPLQADRNRDPDPDWNANQLAFQAAIAPIGREKLQWKDPEKLMSQLRERMQLYIDSCVKYSKKVGNMACYDCLGVTKMDVEKIVTGTFYKKIPQDVVDFFMEVKSFCAAYREGLASDGKINPVTAIFWQKNFDGLRDQQEFIVRPQEQLADKSYEELESKYSKLIVVDAVETD